MHWLAVAVGGAAGAIARYAMALWAAGFSISFPLATFLVNLMGSFLIGAAYVLIVEKGLLGSEWKALLMVGFLGAFTTFSTFSLETLSLIENNQLILAVTYLFASLFCCIVATWLSVQIFRVF